MDPDLIRSFDRFAALAELAAARGVETTTEVSPGLTVADLIGQALSPLRQKRASIPNLTVRGRSGVI